MRNVQTESVRQANVLRPTASGTCVVRAGNVPFGDIARGKVTISIIGNHVAEVGQIFWELWTGTTGKSPIFPTIRTHIAVAGC